MKKGIKTIGFDDGPFVKGQEKTVIVGVIMRGNDYVEGIVRDWITVDGSDSAEKIKTLVKNSRHYNQLKAVFIHGSTMGGFNLLDFRELKKIRKPVITVLRKKPSGKAVKAVKKYFKEKEKIVQSQPEFFKYKQAYFQAVNVEKQKAIELIEKTTRMGNIPEPVRLAHLIATAYVKGESNARA